MYVEFLPDALLATDTAGRYAAYKTGLDAGFLTLDEVRRKENLPALPERIRPWLLRQRGLGWHLRDHSLLSVA